MVHRNNMKTGSTLTETQDLQLSAIKNRYTNNFSSINSETMLSDLLTVLNVLESYSASPKDPRVTIELAKLRKENQSLKKELNKFFPNKDSIETTSKKLEHLFKIDTLTLIRYENSDLKEKNEKLLCELDKYKLKNDELNIKLKDEQINSQKLKEISGELRMENTNLIIKNREINKKIKTLQENSQINENLEFSPKPPQTEAIKSSPTISKDSSIQTEILVSLTQFNHPPISCKPQKCKNRILAITKISHLNLKPQPKKPKALLIQSPNKILCAATKPTKKPDPKPAEATPSPLTLLKPQEKAKLIIQSQTSLFCKPRRAKPQPLRSKSSEPSIPKGKSSVKLETTSELSLSCKASRKNYKIKRFRIVPLISISIKGRKPSKYLSLEQQETPKSFTLAKCSSIVVKPRLRSKEQLLPPGKGKLSMSKTMSASLPNRRKRKMLVSKPSTSSIVPSSAGKARARELSHQHSFSIAPNQKSLSLYTRSIYNTTESEEFEVFNAATVYKPALTLSKPELLSILQAKKPLVCETWSIGCKKKSQRLKLSSFSILKTFTAQPSAQSFKVFYKKTALELTTLRRLSYVPESKATDDEETKSNPGGRARRNRAPPRKPAIEEYFNLVSFT